MKEFTIKNNCTISPCFLERWLNEHPKLTTCGIVFTFLAPFATKVYPDVKRGSKHIFDSWIAHLNYKVEVENGLIASNVVSVVEVSDTDESSAV